MNNQQTEVSFTYDASIDQACQKRYGDFLKENKDVWGIAREQEKILKFNLANITADVSDIVNIYNKIFSIEPISIKGYIVTTPFSMINDDQEFSKNSSIIYFSLFTTNPHLVLAHELFHIYFEKHTERKLPNYDESKEYFTVIMNDLFGKEVSKGYPKHQEIRNKVFQEWLKTKSLDSCLNLIRPGFQKK